MIFNMEQLISFDEVIYRAVEVRSSLQTEMKNQGMKEKYVERFHRLLEDNKRLQNQVTMLQQELSKKVTRVDSNEMGDLREYCSAFDECSDRVEELAAWIMKENKVKQKEVKLEVKDPLENEKMSVECLKKCLN